VQIENVTENQIREIFKAVGCKSMTKEAVPEVFRWLSNHIGKTVEEAMGSIGIRMLSGDDLDRLVDSVIEKHVVLIREKGNNAAGSIIGVIMKEVRGKADASLVSDLVKKKVQAKVKTPKD
jgi:glutamyl-tRNA(Gln) amidotransferase subunit E